MRRMQEAEQDVGGEPLRLPVAEKSGGDAPEPRPIEPADGEDGAKLDGDLKDLAGRRAKAEEVDQQDQVAGGGHRDELGQALNEPEQRRGQVIGNLVNGGVPSSQGAAGHAPTGVPPFCGFAATRSRARRRWCHGGWRRQPAAPMCGGKESVASGGELCNLHHRGPLRGTIGFAEPRPSGRADHMRSITPRTGAWGNRPFKVRTRRFRRTKGKEAAIDCLGCAL